MTALSKEKLLPLVVTLLLAGIVGFFVWQGFKEAPVVAPSSIVTTPPGWVKLSGGDFTLYAPFGGQIRRAQGNGFSYGDIVGTHLCVRYQGGAKASAMLTPKSHPDFTETTLVIDGHTATLRKAYLAQNEQQYWFPGCGQGMYTGLTVPGALLDGGTLVIEVSAGNDDAIDDAVMMFKSLRFGR
jgi:hypothetical protein